MNLAELGARARTLRQQPITTATRAQLEQLRETARTAGVGPAFDREVQALFPVVYGLGALAPPKPNDAPAAFTGNSGGGSKLQFHTMRDPAQIARVVSDRIPDLKTPTPTPMSIEAQFAPLTGNAKKTAMNALVAELEGVRVRGGDGHISLHDKLMQSGLPAERILDVLLLVKTGYERVAEATGNTPPGYQQVNWKHTRLELDRVIDVVKAANLTPAQAETALYASLLSDSVKAPSNFLVHNVHGAQAAVHVLSRLVPPPSNDMIEDVARATLEHQIGPPKFMAYVAIKNALMGAKVDSALIGTITDKVANPLDPKNQTSDHARIAFTDDEKAALAKIGIHSWTVPHEDSRHYGASRAVIDGDSLVNYSCPDGWAKLAEITGPDQPVFLHPPTLIEGLLGREPGKASALNSHYDARSVVSASSLAMYDGGLQRTKMALDRAVTQTRSWVATMPQKDVTLTADGKIPYLDGALDYGNTPALNFARRVREHVVQQLRIQESL